MDFPSINLAELPRHHEQAPLLRRTGHLPEKRQWVRHAFDTFNFSFILGGAGAVRFEGRETRFTAPFVVVQKPGVFMEYGPTGNDAWWEEVFLIFDAGARSLMEKMQYCPRTEVAWPVSNAKALHAALTELRNSLQEVDTPGGADRADRFAHLCIIESRLPAPSEDRGVGATIRRIRTAMERGYHKPWSLEETARQHGISYATLRRAWARQYSTTPNQFLTELRMQEARRLLTQTPHPIADVARRVGFEDPLYFSRRFRQQHGYSARHFRRLHQ